MCAKVDCVGFRTLLFTKKYLIFKDDWNQGDEEDEFADAVVETEEHASMRASRASANVVPATGLKPSDG